MSAETTSSSDGGAVGTASPSPALAPRLLVIDADAIVRQSIASFLEQEGYRVAVAGLMQEGLRALHEGLEPGVDHPADPFAVLVTDVTLPDGDGLELLRTMRREHAGTATIMITGYGTIGKAVESIRLGAIDYLTKPLVDDELAVAVEKAVQQHTLMAENASLRRQLDRRDGLENIVGADPRMCRTYDIVQSVAASRTTVLMCGESGTGKSLIARAIHRHSPRANQPFVEIACGSIPETLLESELFGHVKGAFTGAHTDKPGRFLAADGGTLFLDEINSASPGMQLKLLRVLQERRFEPVGTNETVEVDVRIILASNQPLEALVARGEFRQDLYYRINVVSIELPPLRERVTDIPLLADHFLQLKATEAERQVTGFTPEAMVALRAYRFPGNARELENIVERAVVLAQRPVIGLEDLPEHVIDNSTGAMLRAFDADHHDDHGPWQPMSLKRAIAEQEKQILLAALEAHEWNRQLTADALEINRTTLYKKIRQYGLDELGRAG